MDENNIRQLGLGGGCPKSTIIGAPDLSHRTMDPRFTDGAEAGRLLGRQLGGYAGRDETYATGV
jgi:hypothetical protein